MIYPPKLFGNYKCITLSANYTISSRTYTWEEAITKGNIATPSIEMNNSSLTVNITVDVNNKEAWVGYYLKETAFAYIGKYTEESQKITHYIPSEGDIAFYVSISIVYICSPTISTNNRYAVELPNSGTYKIRKLLKFEHFSGSLNFFFCFLCNKYL
jgi:hypothetical protein